MAREPLDHSGLAGSDTPQICHDIVVDLGERDAVSPPPTHPTETAKEKRAHVIALILLAIFTFVLIAGFVKTTSGTELSTYLIEVVALFSPFVSFVCGYYLGNTK